MAVRMVRVGNMRMHMTQWPMRVSVAVFACRHRLVNMIVMAIVKAMCVFMFHELVLMLMAMRLRQVQNDAGQHQATAQRHQPAG